MNDEVTKTWRPSEDNKILTHRTIPNTKIEKSTPHPYLRDRRVHYLVMVGGKWITDYRRQGDGPISRFKSLDSALTAANERIEAAEENTGAQVPVRK